MNNLNESRNQRTAGTVICVINMALLTGFLGAESMPQTGLRVVGMMAIALCVASGIALFRSAAQAERAVNAQIMLASVLFVVGVLEIVATAAPQVFPIQLRQYLQTADIAEARAQMAIYTDDSPWFQFRPETRVRSQSWRGTDDQFVYEWTTDSLGFKNDSVPATVSVVAVGDSFTEGMGVSVADTWPSQLAGQGITTYNLGVQGYAPSQMAGAFAKYGVAMQPDVVIVGWTATIYEREARFQDVAATVATRNFVGDLHNGELRRIPTFATTAAWMLGREAMRARRHQTPVAVEALAPYAGEFGSIESLDRVQAIRSQSAEWQSTLEALATIKADAEAGGAHVILIYFPQRSDVYYRRATGQDLPSPRVHEVESAGLRAYCDKAGIEYLDATPALVGYVESLPKDAPITEYPYLEVDGHMSAIGYRLAVDTLMTSPSLQALASQ